MRPLMLTAGVGLAVLAATLVARAQDRPGIITPPRVWVENRDRGDAIPVRVISDPDTPGRVFIVNGVGVSGTVTARAASQQWEYRSVVVQPGRDPVPSLTAPGNEGWEATGIQLTTNEGTTLVLKRPR